MRLYFNRAGRRFFEVPDDHLLLPGDDVVRQVGGAPEHADLAALSHWEIDAAEGLARAQAIAEASDDPRAAFDLQVLALQAGLASPKGQEAVKRVAEGLKQLAEKVRDRKG